MMLASVRALVVARCRELAQRPVRVLTSVLLVTVPALAELLIDSGGSLQRSACALTAACVGLTVGGFASPRVRWPWFGPAGAPGNSIRSDVGPALPVTATTRLLATGFIGATLTLPLVVGVLIAALIHERTPGCVPAELGGVAFGLCAAVLWYSFDKSRFYRALTFPSSWLSVRRTVRRSETEATFWSLVPSATATTAFVTLVCAIAAAVLLHGGSWFSRALSEFGALRAVLCLAASSVWWSGLVGKWPALTRLPISRRAVALAELRLTPWLFGVSGGITVAVVQGVAHDPALTVEVLHLFITLGCLGTAVRVIVARVANLMSAHSATVGAMVVSGSIGAGTASVFMTMPALLPNVLLDAVSVLALVVAVALAYTAPPIPLARIPDGIGFGRLRKAGAL